VKVEEHSKGSGVTHIFRSASDLIAPILAGAIVGAVVAWRVYAFSWGFLAIGLALFGCLLLAVNRIKPFVEQVEVPRKKNLFSELRLWKKVSAKLFPVLFLTFYLFFIEAFFWTLSPLLAQQMHFQEFGGFLLTAYSLPMVVLGWFIDPITRRFGKKRSAFGALLLGSFILIFFSWTHQPWLIIAVTLLASLFLGISLPSIDSWYADYIATNNKVEGEVEGLEDFSFNAGYILDPLCAGIFATIFGIAQAFSVIGVIGVIAAFLLIRFAPKHIV
jgi:predicted MFS family arabinose efflux permease